VAALQKHLAQAVEASSAATRGELLLVKEDLENANEQVAKYYSTFEVMASKEGSLTYSRNLLSSRTSLINFISRGCLPQAILHELCPNLLRHVLNVHVKRHDPTLIVHAPHSHPCWQASPVGAQFVKNCLRQPTTRNG